MVEKDLLGRLGLSNQVDVQHFAAKGIPLNFLNESLLADRSRQADLARPRLDDLGEFGAGDGQQYVSAISTV